jgi:Rrf2 family protein
MLSQRCRYALKAMINLSRAPHGYRKSVEKIATEEDIPRKFLEGIMSELRQGGLLDSSRGKCGGYALARPSELITYGQIMRLVDGPLALIGCVSHQFYKRCEDCPDERACELRRVMGMVRNQVSGILDQTTLGEGLAASKTGLIDA